MHGYLWIWIFMFSTVIAGIKWHNVNTFELRTVTDILFCCILEWQRHTLEILIIPSLKVTTIPGLSSYNNTIMNLLLPSVQSNSVILSSRFYTSNHYGALLKYDVLFLCITKLLVATITRLLVVCIRISDCTSTSTDYQIFQCSIIR